MTAPERRIRVTCVDLETGEREERVIWDDVAVIVAGSAHVAEVQWYVNGTQQWTIRGVRSRSTPIDLRRRPSVTDRVRAELTETQAAGIDLGAEYLAGMRAALDQVDALIEGVEEPGRG